MGYLLLQVVQEAAHLADTLVMQPRESPLHEDLQSLERSSQSMTPPEMKDCFLTGPGSMIPPMPATIKRTPTCLGMARIRQISSASFVKSTCSATCSNASPPSRRIAPFQVIQKSTYLLHASLMKPGIPAPQPFFEPAEGTRPKDKSAGGEGWCPHQAGQDDTEGPNRHKHHTQFPGQVREFQP